MSENQVCRRRRPHLQLLRHPMLRTLRRKGHFTVEQGKGKEYANKQLEESWDQIDRVVTSICPDVPLFFPRIILPHSAYRGKTFRRPRRKKITRKIKIERHPSTCDIGGQVDINASDVNNVPSSSDTSRDTGRNGNIHHFKITKKKKNT